MALEYLAMDAAILSAEIDLRERASEWAVLRQVESPFDLDESQFIQLFRLTPEMANNLIEAIGSSLEKKQYQLFLLKINRMETHILIEEPLQDHVMLAECALLVIDRYISTQTNTVVIQEKCNTCRKAMQNFNNRLLEYFLKHFQGSMSLQLFFGKSDDQPWNYNIFIVDTMVAFSKLRVHIPNTLHEREFYFIIILTHKMHKWRMRKLIMMDIFQICVSLKVLHVIVMQHEPERNNSIGFYTFSISGQYCGQSVSIEEVNRYQDGALQHDFLFPVREANFNGCYLNVSANLVNPLLVFEGDPNNSVHRMDMHRLTGTEGDILRILAHALNFRINLDIPSERSEISAGNSTGCFAQLEAGLAEIAIGGFKNAHPDRIKFSLTVPYHQTYFVFVLRTGLHFGQFKQLANPFCPTVWLTLGFTFLLTLAFFKVIDILDNQRLRAFILGHNNKYPNTNMLTIFLGNPINRPPRRNFARFLLMCWLLGTLILRNAYQGKMFDSLRASQHIATPKSITELIESNYKLLSSSFFALYPHNQTIIMFDLKKQYAKIEASTERYTTISILDTLAYHNWLHWNTSHITYVDEPIYMLQVVMYFQKHSVLKLLIDNKLQQLMGAGITAHVAKKHGRSKFQTMNAGLRMLPSISNEMLGGLYLLYGILMGVALFYFILELLSRRVQMLRRFFGWVHCAEWSECKQMNAMEMTKPGNLS